MKNKQLVFDVEIDDDAKVGSGGECWVAEGGGVMLVDVAFGIGCCIVSGLVHNKGPKKVESEKCHGCGLLIHSGSCVWKCCCEIRLKEGFDYISCGSYSHFHQQIVCGYCKILIAVVG